MYVDVNTLRDAAYKSFFSKILKNIFAGRQTSSEAPPIH